MGRLRRMCPRFRSWRVAVTGCALLSIRCAAQTELPNSPGSTLQTQESVVAVAESSTKKNGTIPLPCAVGWMSGSTTASDQSAKALRQKECHDLLNPYQRFLDTNVPIPLTSREKGYLAIRNLTDPFNFATIVATSAFTIGVDSHTAYGPGWKGFGKNAGVSLLQDATGEFFGTYAIPSVFHEDPHYHRMPDARVTRRIFHAVSRTVVAQHDDGTPMPNYSTLLTYPISAEISNLYVPGIHGNLPSTVKRVAIGLATDPIDNVVTEFLPDVAKRVHIRVIFVQRILNQITASENGAQ